MDNGEYSIEVTLEGGSGKASVSSPARLIVSDEKMQAEIEWSSYHYDYMEVDGKDYYPINSSGNSLFLIDVAQLDTDIPIKAETLAMSEPHLIDYTIHFDSGTAFKSSAENSALPITGIILTVTAAAAITAIAVFINKRKNTHVKN